MPARQSGDSIRSGKSVEQNAEATTRNGKIYTHFMSFVQALRFSGRH